MLDSALPTRLADVRRFMREAGVDALLVRSADRHLNEYVPPEDSVRMWVSGFTGSMGEVIVTHDVAYLAVDGRYWIQAEQESPPELYEVLKVPSATAIDTTVIAKLKELVAARGGAPFRVGFDPARLSIAERERFERDVPAPAIFVPLSPSPEARAKGELAAARPPVFRAPDEARLGITQEEKHETLRSYLEAERLDALLVQRLDEIAYLTNLRALELPFQATFRAVALVSPVAVHVGLDPETVPESIQAARPELDFGTEAELLGSIQPGQRIGLAKDHNTEAMRLAVLARGAEPVLVDSPIGTWKAVKADEELRSMRQAFRRADQVIAKAQRWLIEKVLGGKKVSELDFAEKVEALFFDAGASGLSFRVISAFGKNGAIIHYSHPSRKRFAKRGELVLLDTGAYFEEGYATDLTRTFLVDGPKGRGSKKQRELYTLVLKGAIAGLSAVLPRGARGVQLDALVRAPIWAGGYDYAHGTGHGVGINVHEFPPRIGPTSEAVLLPGHVFSIEPGIYLPGWGGIRIENLATVRPRKKHPDQLEVVPLTFSPLDPKLIEPSMLGPDEKRWLRRFHGR